VNDFLDSVAQRTLWLFGAMSDFLREFQRELMGIILIALSLTTAISLIWPAEQGLTAWWGHMATRLLGWGVYPAALLVGVAGALLLVGRFTGRVSLTWSQVVGWELTFFALLGLAHLAVAGEDPVGAASVGRGGGYVGWGIESVLESVLGSVGALALLVLCVLAGVLLILRVSVAQLRLVGQSIRDWLLHIFANMWPESEYDDSFEPEPSVDDAAPADVATTFAPEPAPKPEPGPRTARKRTSVPRVSAPKKPRSAPAKPDVERDATLPPLDLLREDSVQLKANSDSDLKEQIIVETLAGFGIPSRVVDVNRGPTVTQFGVEPGYLVRKDKDGREVRRKVRVSRIHALSNDLALALAASPIRIEAPVPGRPYVGIEVPNDQTTMVSLRGVMEAEAFRKIQSPLAIALGRDVSGTPVAADLAAMPHLLIAGATGSGKSVCINAIVAGLLCQNHPDRLRLLMVDPKRVELVDYNGVPHLISPVVVDLDQVVGALNWVVREMDQRYDRFAEAGARHLVDYNRKMARRGDALLPYLVVVIDELADMMMVAPDQVEHAICRVAQMARATGIHLVIATQRPSVDVVTGLIKANFPARISFAVTSQVDSRVILDSAGAEKLLGRGDMLYMSPESSKVARLQGCYVSDKEIRSVVRFWQKTHMYETLQAMQEDGEVDAEEVEKMYPWEGDEDLMGGGDDDQDDLFGEAVALLDGKSTISTSYLQRALRIGYPRAGRLMDTLEAHGYVGPNQGGGKSRYVLLGRDD
jgi:DNA segregation ATPase FtsK/SpoIIIE, S-DNA-T family